MESTQLKKLNIEDLPSSPSVAVKLLELFDDPDVALKDIAKDIAKDIQVDPALTACLPRPVWCYWILVLTIEPVASMGILV